MGLFVTYRPVGKKIHEDERVGYSGHGNEIGNVSGDDDDERRYISGDDVDDIDDISGGDGRHGFRFQETSHSSSPNCG